MCCCVLFPLILATIMGGEEREIIFSSMNSACEENKESNLTRRKIIYGQFVVFPSLNRLRENNKYLELGVRRRDEWKINSLMLFKGHFNEFASVEFSMGELSLDINCVKSFADRSITSAIRPTSTIHYFLWQCSKYYFRFFMFFSLNA